MTGHQVYSTLHSNSALGALPRLIDIGVSPDIIAGNLIGVIAQRLLRKLCPHCRAPYTPVSAEQQAFAPGAAPASLYRATGCAACNFRGYRGRLAVMEILVLDRELDELIASRASLGKCREYARANGFQTLAEIGLQQVAAGVTSLDELRRVVNLSEQMPA
jgi:type II secretory ATPase GspE/PulE/Tfp pilus assembly ATPase PilB-like protein